MTLCKSCLLWALLFISFLPAFSQEDSLSDNYYRINKRYIGSYFSDFPRVLSAPARYTRKDWTTVAIVVAGTGTVLTLDRSIKKWVQANRNSFFDQTSRIIEPFGNEYSPYIVGAMYLTGVLTKDRRMEHVSLVSAKSLFFSTLLTAGSKQLVRRRRPSYTDDPFQINSMFQGGREWTSFPSGHANTVFTVATAIALQYKEKKWVPYVAYGIAGLTGVSRIYDNRHWATDVLMGAAMGHFITRTVYHIEEAKARKKERRTLSF
jgi:membrane-associated phospholipid phosphatase